MNFELTDEDRQLADVVDKLLRAEWDLAFQRDPSRMDTASRALWGRLGDLGLTTLLVAEADGGAGGTVMQARLVARAIGRHLAATSFLWAAIFPAMVIAHASPGELRTELLRRMVDEGALVVPGFAAGGRALAEPFPGHGGDQASPRQLMTPHGTQASAIVAVDHVRVRGALAYVPVITVDEDTSEVSRQSRSDLQDVAWVTLLHDGITSAMLEVPVDAYLHAVAALKVGLASTATGGLDRAGELASEYAGSREQFGRPIGSFQAVAHRCVDMRTRADGDDMLCELAAWQLDQGERDAPRLAALAKARATRDFVEGSTGALQVFAGHGFSLESDVQLFYRFARGLCTTWGTPEAEYAGNLRAAGEGGGGLAW